LLGHSFGGVVTFGAALAEPSLVSMVVNYESPCPWVLARPSRSPELADDPALAAEQFFRRMVSRGAWDRLSEAERESRRLDGPALLSDLRRMRGPAPYDLGELTVPSVYVHGDWLLTPYYQALCVELHQLNPRITSREMQHAGHGAHLSNPDQLAALILELWSERCASA
jgi:pimeloyl-ACP methyl ester carboxylesterase